MPKAATGGKWPLRSHVPLSAADSKSNQLLNPPPSMDRALCLKALQAPAGRLGLFYTYTSDRLALRNSLFCGGDELRLA